MNKGSLFYTHNLLRFEVKLVHLYYLTFSHSECFIFLTQEWFKTEVSMLIFQAVVRIRMWAAAKRTIFFFSPSGLYYTHIHLGANHLCVPDGMLALWLSGCGSAKRDRDTNSRICIALVSACFFSRHPAVCCSFLGAQAICAMVTVPACQLRHRFHLSSPSLPA